MTTDQSLRYQQNLDERPVGIVVLMANAWPRVRLHANEIADAITAVRPGEVVEVQIRRG